ncbi:MAG: serine hydrolase domain-containing protein [Kofleriaceae bacterium]
MRYPLLSVVIVVLAGCRSDDARVASPGHLQSQLRCVRVRDLDAARLDAFVTHAFDALHIPGAAIAVIVDGKVVYERMLGVRVLGQTAPVTAGTRFMLGSVTKPLTTFLQATLVDAGTIAWTTPVHDLMPAFAVAGGLASRLALWHLMCGCSGVDGDDIPGMFTWEGITPEARIAALRTAQATAPLGEKFQYSNQMFAAGGFMAAHAFAPTLRLAKAYSSAMQAKVFAPIGMTATTTDFAVVEAGDHALPHALAIDGTTHALPLAIERAVLPIAPAGAVWSTLHDMERYVLTELSHGIAPDGTRVASAANLAERARQRIAIDASTGYGLGLDISNDHGLRVLSHDGGSFGFGTTLYLLPEARTGIVILTNVRNGTAESQLPFNEAVTRRIVEALVATTVPDAEELLSRAVKARARDPRPPVDRSWLGALAGRYHEPVLGRIEVRDSPDGPLVDVGEWRSTVARIESPDGSAKLLLLDPPFAGGALLVGTDHTLTLPGSRYIFRRE